MFHSDIFEVNSPHVRIILRQPFHTLSMLPTLHPMCSVWNSHVCWSMSNPSIHSSIHPSIHPAIHPSIHPCNSLKLLITIIYCYDMIAVLVTIFIYIYILLHIHINFWSLQNRLHIMQGLLCQSPQGWPWCLLRRGDAQAVHLHVRVALRWWHRWDFRGTFLKITHAKKKAINKAFERPGQSPFCSR